MNELCEKKAMVTGGSSGIGRAIAIAYAQEGADVVFSYYKHQKEANELVSFIKSLGRKVKAIHVDMNNFNHLNQFVEEGVNYLSGIDIFVNNAGMLTRHAGFLNIPLDAFDLIQTVNVRAPFFLTQRIAQCMQRGAKGGSIINISSMSAFIISAGLTHYECSKAALNMLTKAAAHALAKDNIRVNAIAPGLVATNMNRHQREYESEIWDKREARIPLQRVGKPEDIAYVAVMLASPRSAWITGNVIPVDGGLGL